MSMYTLLYTESCSMYMSGSFQILK